MSAHNAAAIAALRDARIEELQYTINKRIPAMSAGFAIHTDYGEIPIDGDDATAMQQIVERIMAARLERLERL